MDQDFGHPLAALPPPEPPPRYAFDKPAHSTADLLTVQLAECVRVVRALSDQAVEPSARDWERTPTIHAIDNVIGSSAKLAEWIDRIENGAPPQEQRNAGRKGPES
ncbi:MAG: hypothetical protein JOY77_10175 [Alphaproteobacteria bacterium]|nr:hypothetical protein [Alphaproteobacteria bacterium]MBV9063275.1 hypothetical protein [Alphaproteobacteria bacterium]